jgi:hypothetical protein
MNARIAAIEQKQAVPESHMDVIRNENSNI